MGGHKFKSQAARLGHHQWQLDMKQNSVPRLGVATVGEVAARAAKQGSKLRSEDLVLAKGWASSRNKRERIPKRKLQQPTPARQLQALLVIGAVAEYSLHSRERAHVNVRTPMAGKYISLAVAAIGAFVDMSYMRK